MEFGKVARDAAEQLRQALDNAQYDVLAFALRGVGYYVDPWPNFYEFGRRITRLPTNIQTLLSLCYLGKPVGRREAEQSLGRELVELLVEGGFLKSEGDRVSSAGLGVVPYQGSYLACSLPANYPTSVGSQPVYIGRDSYGLATALSALSGKSGLDMCSGCGIQAIQLAKRMERVAAVEFLDEAAAIAEFNVALNNLDSKIEVRRGDMWSSIGGGFDCVVANPPFLPIPKGLDYPATTNGGVDGLQQLLRVFTGLKTHLNNGGTFLMIGEAMGNSESPILVRHLHALVREGFQIDLVLISREIAIFIAYLLGEVGSHVVQRNPHELAELFKENFARQGSGYYYHYFLRMRNTGRGGLDVIKLHGDWTPEDIPKKLAADSKVDTFVLGNLSETHRKILQKCDEKRSVRAIAQELIGADGEPAAVRAMQRVLNYCDDLEALHFLGRDRLVLH